MLANKMNAAFQGSQLSNRSSYVITQHRNRLATASRARTSTFKTRWNLEILYLPEYNFFGSITGCGIF